MKKELFLLENKIGITREQVRKADVKSLIEEQTLIVIESFEEAIFTSGKVEKDFFIYLIVMLEDYYSIGFPDDMLKIEKFDTVEKIVEMISKIK